MAEGLLKIVVQAVNAVLLRGGEGTQSTPPLQQLPQALADGRIVADPLGDDVICSLQSVRRRLHALVRVDEVLGSFLRPGAVSLLGKQQLCQGFQPLFPGYGGAGAAFLLVGAVEILHLCQGLGAVDGGGQFLRQLALLLDGLFHRIPAFLQPAEVLEPFLQRPEGGVVHSAMKLLAVAGNEGDRVALVQQPDHVFHMPGVLIQLLRQRLNHIHACCILSLKSHRRDGGGFWLFEISLLRPA